MSIPQKTAKQDTLGERNGALVKRNKNVNAAYILSFRRLHSASVLGYQLKRKFGLIRYIFLSNKRLSYTFILESYLSQNVVLII